MKRSEKSKEDVAVVATEQTEAVESKEENVMAEEEVLKEEDSAGEVLSEEDMQILKEAAELEEDFEEEDEKDERIREVETVVSAVLKQLNLDRTFEKRRTHMADKSTKKKLYQEDENVVRDKTGKTLTETQKVEKAFARLMRAARSIPYPTILTGKIVGVQETETILWAIVEEIDEDGRLQKEVQIKIPSEQLFVYNSKDYEGPNGRNYLKYELIARIGSEIRFIVYDVKETEKFVIGSRLAALERDGIANYVKLQNDGAPKYCNEMVVPARVIGVRKDRVRVEVMGADATISNRELSWTALDVLTDEFRNGDTFHVKVSDVQVQKHTANGRTYNLVHLKASRREAMPNPADMYYDDFNVGDYCSGVIKAEASETGVFVNLQDKMDALCYVPAHGVPQKGMSCIVEITDKKDEDKHIFGKIIRMG